MVSRTIAIFAVMTALACSCSRTADMDDCGLAELDITVSTAEAGTKAIEKSTSFASGTAIGISLQSGSGTYDGISYANVKSTASGSGASQTWANEKSILLSSTSGTLYGYYPYSSTVTDVANIPVTATSSSQTDYMYATAVSGLKNTNRSASLTMKHALAGISVTVKKGTYTGTGSVTSVGFASDGIGTGAALNAKIGALSSVTGTGTSFTSTTSFTLSASGTAREFMVVPAGTSKTITFTVIVDGITYSVTTAAVDLPEGKITSYTLTVNAEGMTLSSVSITAWTTGAAADGALTLKPV